MPILQHVLYLGVLSTVTFTAAGRNNFLRAQKWLAAGENHHLLISYQYNYACQPFRENVYIYIYIYIYIYKLGAEERTTNMSSLHFLHVNSKLGRQHTRRRWQPLSAHL